jgi:PRC-barrel domain
MRDWQPTREHEEASTMTDHQQDANWNVAEWHGKMLVDRDGERIGKLQDVVDVENDEPQFATVKEGFIGRHLTFVPLGGITEIPMSCR